MRHALWLLLLASALVLTAACGGDSDSSSADITITPDLTQRREGLSEQEALELFQAIMERRAQYIDGSAEVTINADNTLSINYSDIADDIAADLYAEVGDLAIRGPKRQGDEMIVCLLSADEEVYIPFDSIVYEQSGTSAIPRCQLENGLAANIAWEDIEVPSLGTMNNLDIASVALQTETGPTLIIGFNEAGSQKLAAVTQQIVGLPMGIFIDGDLVAGPRVSEFIQNGQIAIAGLSLRQARILRAQLRAGAIPAPFTAKINA
jgi:hypothetical protein